MSPPHHYLEEVYAYARKPCGHHERQRQCGKDGHTDGYIDKGLFSDTERCLKPGFNGYIDKGLFSDTK